MASQADLRWAKGPELGAGWPSHLKMELKGLAEVCESQDSLRLGYLAAEVVRALETVTSRADGKGESCFI